MLDSTLVGCTVKQIAIDFLMEHIIQIVTQGQMTHSLNILVVNILLATATNP